MRYRPKVRDLNERALVAALRGVGAWVVHPTEKGAPDLWVASEGLWTPLEVKNQDGRNRLYPEQVVFGERAEAEGVAYGCVRTVAEAFAVLGLK